MRYYNYRFWELSEQVLKNLLLEREWWYIDGDLEEHGAALEFAMDMDRRIGNAAERTERSACAQCRAR